MTIPCYQVDAFAERVFEGNPAAVCLLKKWLPDETMCAIAAEFNLSETAFVVGRGADWAIRWFTPACEVELCGHATLAAAHVLINECRTAREHVQFMAGIGALGVAARGDGLLELDFPSRPPYPLDPPGGLAPALGAAPSETFLAEDLLCVYPDEAAVRDLAPDFARLALLPGRGVIVTAPGSDCDFVSRFFAPKVGVPEDPVTGSAHTTLAPYWAARFGRRTLTARQISRRGGALRVEDRGARVGIAGNAVTVATGTLHLPER